MPRAPTTLDSFSAIAEPQRRQILGYLAQGEHSVGDIARSLQMEQPQTSKHLKVLLKVDLVRVREAGKQRMYRLNPPALKPIYSWIQPFEQLWNERLDRLDEYLAHKGER